MATVLITAFYTTRMWVLVFLGKPRSKGAEHAHESPASMTLPLMMLAALTCVAGYRFVAATGRAGGRNLKNRADAVLELTAIASCSGALRHLLGLQNLRQGPGEGAAAEAGLGLHRHGQSLVGECLLRLVGRRVVLALGSFIALFDKRVSMAVWWTARRGDSDASDRDPQALRRSGARAIAILRAW